MKMWLMVEYGLSIFVKRFKTNFISNNPFVMKTIYQSNRIAMLTTREIEIINLIILEQSTREIASILHLSFETIKSHRKSIMNKLDAKNVAGIVREAFLRGFVKIEKNTIKINDRLTIAS